MRVSFQSRLLPVATVFCGSFLLFMIQPLLGRSLLPVFGGSASVWCICLACYQTLLLVGYVYAHGIALTDRLRRVHVAVAVLAALWALMVAFKRGALLAWLGAGDARAVAVLVGVALFVGIPYVTLAAGSTLVQAWLAKENEGAGPGADVAGAGGPTGNSQRGASSRSPDVYRLYAVSNFGSLLGLLSYPFVLEPFVSLTVQWYGLAAGLAAYAVLLARVALRGESGREGRPRIGVGDLHVDGQVGGHTGSPRLWLLLPGVTTFLLNATTAHLSVDVAPMPMVWAVLLAAFLLSYVMGFSPWGERRRGVWCACAGVALAGAAVVRGMWGTGSFFPNAWAGVAVLFFVGTVIHSWLYALRPETARLTRYYLCGAAGGAVGGLLSSLVAPLLFNRITEYPLALFVCAILVAWRAPKPLGLIAKRWGGWSVAAGCGVAWLVLAHAMNRQTQAHTLFSERNFYGCLAVTQTFERLGPQHAVFPVNYLWCGQTTHGIQIHAPNPLIRNTGTAYYGPQGGGIAFSANPKVLAGEALKVGVVGLGAGTLACYGRPGDLFRFYEINPQVVKVATDPQLFTFLPDAKMPIDLVLGDARRMLEKERAAHDPLYDVLVIDAYSGDAVPYHLATREAFRLYLDRLDENGILAVHVSNWHIDLLPLCKAMATELGVCAYGAITAAQSEALRGGAIWVFMTRHPIAYRYPGKEKVCEVVWSDVRDISAPTDEKGSLLSLIRY